MTVRLITILKAKWVVKVGQNSYQIDIRQPTGKIWYISNASINKTLLSSYISVCCLLLLNAFIILYNLGLIC